MLHSIGGNINSHDVRVDRIAAGTVGGEHMVTRSIQGGKLTSLVDNTDPRLVYGIVGSGTATFSSSITGAFTKNGSVVYTSTTNGAIQLRFNGNSIGMLGSVAPLGDPEFYVYIDGALSYGRSPVASPISFTAGTDTPSSPAIDDDSTTITVVDGTLYTSSGYVLVDNEVIQYSSISGNTLTIQARAQFDTAQTDHNYTATVYQWTNVFSCYSPDSFSNQKLLFYNPFLASGPHLITLVCSGGGRLYFDGFITGPLIGASSMSIEFGTLLVTGTTSANGHLEIGRLTTSNTNVQLFGIVGYSQTTPDTTTDTTNTMAKLGFYYDGGDASFETQPILYLHNGPGASAIAVMITIAYIGETI